MSTMALASSSLNPNAPLFIPAAYRQVEDFSPEWWELVQTTAWFRDHWFRQHQLYEDDEAQQQQHDAALAALPDDLLDTDDLFYAPEPDRHQQQQRYPSEADVLRALSLAAPRHGADQHLQHQIRYADKPAQHVGFKVAERRVVHQPR